MSGRQEAIDALRSVYREATYSAYDAFARGRVTKTQQANERRAIKALWRRLDAGKQLSMEEVEEITEERQP